MDRGSAPRKAHMTTQAQNKRTQTSMLRGIQTHHLSAWAGGDSSYLKPRGHSNRIIFSIKLNNFENIVIYFYEGRKLE
jgi:hypothetical protein